MKRTIACWLFAAFAIAAANEARACTPVTPDFRPTNFELVQLADAIVVATALRSDEWDDPNQATHSYVEFRTDVLMKGAAPGSIRLDDMFFEDHPRSSSPNDLTEVNPEAMRGGCIRQVFAKGGQYVLFLTKTGSASIEQLSYPFTRVNEDYLGEDSLWVQAIRAYVDVQRTDDVMAQMDELDRLRSRLAGSPSEQDRLIAADIQQHLQSFSPYKPRAFLEDSLSRIERGEDPRHGLGEGVSRDAAKADILLALAAQEPGR